MLFFFLEFTSSGDLEFFCLCLVPLFFKVEDKGVNPEMSLQKTTLPKWLIMGWGGCVTTLWASHKWYFLKERS